MKRSKNGTCYHYLRGSRGHGSGGRPGIRDYVRDFDVNAAGTPLAARLLAGADAAYAIARKHAMKRIGTGDDMARMTAFLLSPESGWITGQVIRVEGGRSVLDSPG
jgi:NAD(P)-dependent dehydrogenase (short-subunit alcohol dehydrogenase family)